MDISAGITRGPAGIICHTPMAPDHFRKVRSFVRRSGRITKAQQRALTTLLPRWGIPYGESGVDLDETFGRRAPRVLDIGFGDGEALLTTAANYPEHRLPRRRGPRARNRASARTDREGWPRQHQDHRPRRRRRPRPHDRRRCSRRREPVLSPIPGQRSDTTSAGSSSPTSLAAVARVLVDGGLFHVATDWADYAVHTRDVLTRCGDFKPAICRMNLAATPSPSGRRPSSSGAACASIMSSTTSTIGRVPPHRQPQALAAREHLQSNRRILPPGRGRRSCSTGRC